MGGGGGGGGGGILKFAIYLWILLFLNDRSVIQIPRYGSWGSQNLSFFVNIIIYDINA